MNSKNDWIRDYLGVTAWHKAGYTGKRGLTASGEDYENISGHPTDTYEIFHEIAPDRKVVFQMFGKTESLCQKAEELGIDTMFVSLSNDYMHKDARDYLDKHLPDRISVFVSSGNEADESRNAYMLPERVYGVGAIRLQPTAMHDGCPKPDAQILILTESYTSKSEYVDFAAPAGLYVNTYRRFYGTSCACPVLCGMAALVNDFAIEHTGRPLTDSEMIQFLSDCAIDVDRSGKDDLTGIGLPILPPPETVDIWKYQTGIEKEVIDMSRDINLLHPELKSICIKFIDECRNKGFNVGISQTYRTKGDQDALYAQGRTLPGSIITNCKYPYSPHCWGVAFDIYRNDGRGAYDDSDHWFASCGAIGKSLGLFWGGDFKSFVDKPHFELPKYLPNNSCKTLIGAYGTPENFIKTWKDDYMTKKEILAELGDAYIENYEQLPDWAKPTMRKLLDDEIINGGTDKVIDPDDINMTLSDVKTIVIVQRMLDTMTKHD